ncbi:hypothetical protein SUGI_1023690 [Cryptomeria japonica]|uniref:peroxidase 3-like n=1 Tax=Cryptomeria japonica TaxID=3369 RepID=UPI002414AAE2|nr:peroxidase 3-like [Cryptomeria japonica]GLJ48512.1 hypothetical protein SUGI_1023690 [Cryptomeria japonica]
MASKKSIVVGLILSVLSIVARSATTAISNGKTELKLDFYKRSCPEAEKIVRSTVDKYISSAPSLAAPILRMYFHDCFVRGCDGSVLLNSTNKDAEKDAIPNLSLRGFQVIDAAKAELEKQCPGVVSCADILALVTRDAVDMIGGPVWSVPMGRRDGVISLKKDALTNLPSPSASFEQLKSSFIKKGLNMKDLVVLSGAHTIGTSHCGPFATRISKPTDPSLAESYANKLRIKCKPGDNKSLVEMDPGSFRTFDNHYYINLRRKRGLFASDAALVTDAEANSFINSALASSTSNSTSWFFTEFGRSMEKMGTIDILTGNAGQIRRHCALVN